jgi:serine/threonine protein kinase
MNINFEKPRKALQEKLNSEEAMDSKFEVVKRYQDIIDDKELIDCLEDTLVSAKEIGFGNNATVYNLPGFDSLCVKKIKKYPKVVINSLDEEAEFQQEVFNLGIPTPRYFKKLRHKETRQEYMVMEKIDGFSLGDILENPQIEKFSAILEKYNHEYFFKKLTSMIQTLHKNNIYHRDLHSGNIMITKDGEPVIIDWGAASKEYLTDSDEIYVGSGKTLVDPTSGKYQWGSGRLLNDDEQLRLLEQSMLAMQRTAVNEVQ